MRLLVADLVTLCHRPATLVITIVLAIGVAIGLVSIGTSGGPAVGGGDSAYPSLAGWLAFPQAIDFAARFVLAIGVFLALAYGAAVASAEWRHRTFEAAVARGESPMRYVLILIVATAMVLGAVAGVCLAVGVGASAAAAAVDAVQQPARDPAILTGYWSNLLRVWLGMASIMTLGFAMTVATRSQLAGIGAGFAIYVSEQALTTLNPDSVRYLPFRVADQLSSGPALGRFEVALDRPLDPALAAALAFAWLAVWVLIALGIASRVEAAR
jgi:hypothetical protein